MRIESLPRSLRTLYVPIAPTLLDPTITQGLSSALPSPGSLLGLWMRRVPICIPPPPPSTGSCCVQSKVLTGPYLFILAPLCVWHSSHWARYLLGKGLCTSRQAWCAECSVKFFTMFFNSVERIAKLKSAHLKTGVPSA